MVALLLAAAVAVSGFMILRTIGAPGENGGGHGLITLSTLTPANTSAPTATTAPTATSTPMPTGTPMPTATPIPQPVLALSPTTWQIHRQYLSSSTWCYSTPQPGGADTPLTITNNGPDPVYWSWGWGSQTPPHNVFYWLLKPSTAYQSGTPNDAKLQPGSADTLEIKMYCPTTQTPYTITLFELDNVTGQSVSQTITLIVPAAKG